MPAPAALIPFMSALGQALRVSSIGARNLPTALSAAGLQNYAVSQMDPRFWQQYADKMQQNQLLKQRGEAKMNGAPGGLGDIMAREIGPQ